MCCVVLGVGCVVLCWMRHVVCCLCVCVCGWECGCGCACVCVCVDECANAADERPVGDLHKRKKGGENMK